MPTKMLTKKERTASQPPTAVPEVELRERAQEHLKRVRRLRINAAAWALGTIVLTTLWVLNQWQANGAPESFGHEGEPGQWNPTLWALGVGIWGLIVGTMALRVHFRRPTTEAEVDREVERLKPHRAAKGAPTDAELRRFARTQVDRIHRLKFHVAALGAGAGRADPPVGADRVAGQRRL